MDILFEKTIAGAQVSLKGGRHRPGPEHRIAMAAAFPASGAPDARDVAAFIRPLARLEVTDLDELVASLADAPLPTGYRHFRLFDTASGEVWHESFVVQEGGVNTLHSVIFGAMNHPTLELSAWKHTEWLPDAILGVLDLEIDIATRCRTRPLRLRL